MDKQALFIFFFGIKNKNFFQQFLGPSTCVFSIYSIYYITALWSQGYKGTEVDVQCIDLIKQCKLKLIKTPKHLD